MKHIKKLISISSNSISAGEVDLSERFFSSLEGFAECIENIYRLRNGFYAFEGALHFFPAAPALNEIEVKKWNSRECWINCYDDLADGCIFFAEDIFGGQFCLADGGVYTFDPETGERGLISKTIDQWAEAILDDYEVLTGFPLAHDWQVLNGAIPAGSRLLPKLPFVVGGEFKLDNLYLCESVKGMRFRGEIARQIRDLPDGAEIKFVFTDSTH